MVTLPPAGEYLRALDTEVGQDLGQLVRVRQDGQQRAPVAPLQTVCQALGRERRQRLFDRRRHIEGLYVHSHVVLFDARHVEHICHEMGQPLSLAVHRLNPLARCRRVHLAIEQQLREANQRGQGGPELVRHGAQELPLQMIDHPLGLQRLELLLELEILERQFLRRAFGR